VDDTQNKRAYLGQTGGDIVGVRQTEWVVVLLRALVAGCAVVVSIWAKCPWPGMAGLGLLGGIALAAELSPRKLPAAVWKCTLAIACALSLLVPATPCLVADANFTLSEYGRYYQAVLAWLVAVSVVPAGIRAGTPGRLRLLTMGCALVGDSLWLAGSWSHNLRGVFYLGLLVAVALLILCKLWFRLPGPAVVGANTLVMLIVVLGVADLLVPPPPRLDPHLATARKYYSYEIARKDPLAFARWWDYFLEQWLVMSKAIIVPAHGHAPSCYLRPGARSRLFDCPISINSLGFRGREIEREKGDAYRIVALGESTTFGCTLGLEDKPWPALLEQMIRGRLNPPRPVEVINAGVPGYTLEDNLHRLAKDVLPLKPDMIISYHGYNGFPLLDESLPIVHGPAPPVYWPRPLTMVANFEYRLKVLRYRQRQTARPAPHAQTVSDMMKTKYAGAYGELVQIAKTNHVRLVLANFAMAVNSQSDQDVIEFYRAGFPFVKWQIEANRLHSVLVQEIAQQNPAVCLVDTHPALDGEHEKFVDLVHLTQEGRRQLAEAFFAGIRTKLEEDLARSDGSASAP
jgi:lysophospholipase L1-like esterase